MNDDQNLKKSTSNGLNFIIDQFLYCSTFKHIYAQTKKAYRSSVSVPTMLLV